MKQNKVLYTGFKKAHPRDANSSFQLLERLTSKRIFLFTNDYDSIDREVEYILGGCFDEIIMFGQKPSIKRLCVERCAKCCDEILSTNYDLSKIEKIMKENCIDFKYSNNPGNSYCNYAYFQMLKLVKIKKLKTKVIFIHIPYVQNFYQMDDVLKLFNTDNIF